MFNRWYDEKSRFRYIIPAIIAGGAALAGTAILAGSQGSANNANIRMTERIQKQQWKRDDTAVQRRAKDLRAAGFNPVLAAGDAAGNTAVAPPTVQPLVKENPGRAVGAAIDAMVAKEQLANVREQTELIRQQQQSVKADTWNKSLDGVLKTAEGQFAMDYYRGRAGLPGASAAAQQARADLTNHDLALLREVGIPSMVAGAHVGPSGVPAWVAGKGLNLVKDAAPSIVEKAKGASERSERGAAASPNASRASRAELMEQSWFQNLGQSMQSTLLDRPVHLWPPRFQKLYRETLGSGRKW